MNKRILFYNYSSIIVKCYYRHHKVLKEFLPFRQAIKLSW